MDYVIMHLFQCVICKGQMAGAGRDKDGRCLYCATVYRGFSDEHAVFMEWHDRFEGDRP